ITSPLCPGVAVKGAWILIPKPPGDRCAVTLTLVQSPEPVAVQLKLSKVMLPSTIVGSVLMRAAEALLARPRTSAPARAAVLIRPTRRSLRVAVIFAIPSQITHLDHSKARAKPSARWKNGSNQRVRIGSPRGTSAVCKGLPGLVFFTRKMFFTPPRYRENQGCVVAVPVEVERHGCLPHCRKAR